MRHREINDYIDIHIDGGKEGEREIFFCRGERERESSPLMPSTFTWNNQNFWKGFRGTPNQSMVHQAY